ncbi:DUF5692 family protein [Slackia heliotrinireducens]|uniref:DUF5692 family protein n=1 Tax=Slackia heliotrinireducens TaxID=84110 RepID=UPI00331585D3
MLFEVYGENAVFQWVGWLLVFVGLIGLNEFARRSKTGGIIMFVALPICMTIYCIAVTAGAASGATWAVDNPTVLFQNGWFHYAKVYAALTGCIGFMIIKYHWGKLGKAEWFKAFPFVIVAINILIAVVSDFESFAHFVSGDYFLLDNGSAAWITSEHATQLTGWHNLINGIAGIINIFCMTGWWAVYSSKKKQQDMIWADMTWVFIIAYDLWNFCYTYNCLPNHAWYCGLALLLAPTVANALWNKGGWIQNRANTLAIWCMFAQVFPQFQDSFPEYGLNSPFAVNSVLSTQANTIVSVIALLANIAAIAYIFYRAKKLGVNPYKKEVFVGTKDYEAARARIADGECPEHEIADYEAAHKILDGNKAA